MKRILACCVGLAALSTPAFAQDAALRERVNRLSVYVEELQADKARQQKQIADLTREVERLKEQMRQSTDSASDDDLRQLRTAVEQLNKKHRDDMAVVADQIEKLGSTPPPTRQAPSAASGYPHTIAKGDTLSAIATAYQRELGIRVTVDDILAANPGLDPKKLKIGDVIMIPDR